MTLLLFGNGLMQSDEMYNTIYEVIGSVRGMESRKSCGTVPRMCGWFSYAGM